MTAHVRTFSIPRGEIEIDFLKPDLDEFRAENPDEEITWVSPTCHHGYDVVRDLSVHSYTIITSDSEEK